MEQTTTLLDNEKEHPLPAGFGIEVFRCQVGSGVHGVTVGGQDDRDEMGICVERPEYVVGLKKFEQWIYRTQPEGHRSGYGDLDLTVYSLRKWMRLALAGNPTILLPLFVPPVEVVCYSDVWSVLQANTDRFLSRQIADRFLGYMQSQREQMEGLRSKKHTNRPELIEIHGYDTKFAYHMLRLGYQGIELLETGKITIPMPEDLRLQLIDVRQGFYKKETVLAESRRLEDKLLELRSSTNLPPEPDYTWANQFLQESYLDVWCDNGWI